ncbi:rhamnosyltransferase WsaF family glycosyltransferase, partial [Mesorhizobium sp. P5_C1]
EAHAKRNLFPLALIALEEMTQQGSFVGPWEFHGVGALAETTIPLGRGHKLNLHAKMTEAEYEAFMHKVDVGLSLMYAPHPGLVAFEMASIGARVVTNTVDGRSEAHLRGLSENIIPCEPTISGIKQALTEAIESLHDFSGRVRGMRINRSHGVKSWSEVFNDEFFQCEMDGFLGTDQQIVSEKTS